MTVVWRTLSFGGGGVSVVVSGTPAVGETLHCAAPDGATFQWLREGAPIPGATGADHVVATLDQGKDLACVASVTSDELAVPGAPTTIAFFGDSFAGSLTDGLSDITKNFPHRATQILAVAMADFAKGGARNVLNTDQIATQVYQKDGEHYLRSSAPYAPSFPIVVLQASVNNLTLDAMVAAPSIVAEAIKRGIHHLRAGGAYEVRDATRWSFTGSWVDIPDTTASYGSGHMRATANGDAATLTTPADFPGAKLRLFGPKLSGFGGTLTFTIDGSAAGSLNVADATVQGNSQVWEKELTVGAGAHTIAATVSSIATVLNINGADFEAAEIPLVVVSGAARSPNYPGGEHDPTDANVLAMNSAVQSMLTSTFPSDPKVVYFDMDAALGKDGSLFGPDQIHPNDAGAEAIAQALATAITAAVS
jgi:hypothetical protein